MQYCPQCGTNNSNSNKTCQTCGAPLGEQPYMPSPAKDRVVYVPVKDDSTLWLVLNIICALCCCQVLGIIGAVFAGLAKTSYRNGDLGDAEHKIQTAKTLFMVGVIVGGILSFILLIIRPFPNWSFR